MTQPSIDGQRGSPKRFSHREIEVLGLASQGMTNPEIANRLGVSVHAIKFHLGSVYKKLGAANRTEAAVAYALNKKGRTADGHSFFPSVPAALAHRPGPAIHQARRRGLESLLA